MNIMGLDERECKCLCVQLLVSLISDESKADVRFVIVFGHGSG